MKILIKRRGGRGNPLSNPNDHKVADGKKCLSSRMPHMKKFWSKCKISCHVFAQANPCHSSHGRMDAVLGFCAHDESFFKWGVEKERIDHHGPRSSSSRKETSPFYAFSPSQQKEEERITLWASERIPSCVLLFRECFASGVWPWNLIVSIRRLSEMCIIKTNSVQRRLRRPKRLLIDQKCTRATKLSENLILHALKRRFYDFERPQSLPVFDWNTVNICEALKKSVWEDEKGHQSSFLQPLVSNFLLKIWYNTTLMFLSTAFWKNKAG